MNDYEFTLILDVDYDDFNAAGDKLGNDGTLSISESVCRFALLEEGASLHEAIISAIKDVNQAGYSVIRVEVDEPTDAVDAINGMLVQIVST